MKDSNARLVLTNTSFISPLNSFTVEMWINPSKKIFVCNFIHFFSTSSITDFAVISTTTDANGGWSLSGATNASGSIGSMDLATFLANYPIPTYSYQIKYVPTTGDAITTSNNITISSTDCNDFVAGVHGNILQPCTTGDMGGNVFNDVNLNSIKDATKVRKIDDAFLMVDEQGN